MFINIINLRNEIEENTVAKLVALSNIMRMAYHGKHIVKIESSDFDFIKGSDLFGYEIKSIASMINENKREVGAIADEVSILIEVDFLKNEKHVSAQKKNGLDVLTISYHLFEENDGSCHLLVENTIDFKLYNYIAKTYSKVFSNCHAEIHLEIIDGGGSNIYEIFKTQRDTNKICLCIVDSDKKHPGGPLGGTSSQFQKKDKELNRLSLVKIIDSHEAESIIPIKHIENTMTHFKYPPKNIEQLDIMKSAYVKKPASKLFIDHKVGLKKHKAITLDNLHGNFWNIAFDLQSINKSCTKDCKICNEDCMVFSGLGEGMLNNSIELLEKTSFHKIIEIIEPELKAIWQEIGKSLYSWGCGQKKMPRVS